MQHPPAEIVVSTHHGRSARPHAGRGLDVASLDYELPARCIATHPGEPRDAAKMLVLKRSDAQFIEHRRVQDLPEYLQAGDALVFNDTSVAPARLEMRRREGAGGRVEGLFLEEIRPTAETSRRDTVGDRTLWKVMLRSGGRITPGERLALLDREERASGLSLRIIEHQSDQWIVEVDCDHARATSTRVALDRVGRTPLPPYIVKARQAHHESYRDADDQQWYQTVYADAMKRQSVAAPTAGLHFTPELLKRIEAMGVRRIDVTLHVGLGTFKPVAAATLDEHRMHSEWYEVSPAAMEALCAIRGGERKGRVIAVGTTSVRALESLPADALARGAESCGGSRGLTDLLIAPPHDFRHIDGMLTNFHLPRSTLLALVAAMVGLDRLLVAYHEAIQRDYRFYSYGDAMLILP